MVMHFMIVQITNDDLFLEPEIHNWIEYPILDDFSVKVE